MSLPSTGRCPVAGTLLLRTGSPATAQGGRPRALGATASGGAGDVQAQGHSKPLQELAVDIALLHRPGRRFTSANSFQAPGILHRPAACASSRVGSMHPPPARNAAASSLGENKTAVHPPIHQQAPVSGSVHHGRGFEAPGYRLGIAQDEARPRRQCSVSRWSGRSMQQNATGRDAPGRGRRRRIDQPNHIHRRLQLPPRARKVAWSPAAPLRRTLLPSILKLA